jgi:toxin-antitoxin system PIN domain toxin
MIVLDANVLIYAYNDQAPEHQRASAWLMRVLNGTEPLGLPWTTIWAFLRVMTSKKIWQTPGSPERAFQTIRELLDQPSVTLLNPGLRHAELLEELVTGQHAVGPLVSNAALAALTIENGAVLASTDRDFSRFPNLRCIDPLTA